MLEQHGAAAGDYLGEAHSGPGAMNEIWTPWLPKDGAPARACVQAEMAAPDVLVETMVTACE
jgi:enamine deaminase RidA (YjgF/YER057c/UK114 family)